MILGEATSLISDRCNLVSLRNDTYSNVFRFHQSSGVERYVYVISFTNCKRNADMDYLQSGDIRFYFDSLILALRILFYPANKITGRKYYRTV